MIKHEKDTRNYKKDYISEQIYQYDKSIIKMIKWLKIPVPILKQKCDLITIITHMFKYQRLFTPITANSKNTS